jgi:hypothetical protein
MVILSFDFPKRVIRLKRFNSLPIVRTFVGYSFYAVKTARPGYRIKFIRNECLISNLTFLK